MKKPPLYPKREEIVRVIRRLGYPWAAEVAASLDRQYRANEERAAKAHLGPQAYSAALQEKLIAAIQPRTLKDPRCVAKTLDRIAEHKPETFGLDRPPGVKTMRAAVVTARGRSAADLQAIRLNKVSSVTGTTLLANAGLLPFVSTFSTSTAST